MKRILGYTPDIAQYENEIAEYLKKEGYLVEENCIEDLYELSVEIARKLQMDPDSAAVYLTRDGIVPFMVASKFDKVVCAQVSDEHSAMMTRRHNGANAISIGSDVCGIEIAKRIIKAFYTSSYDGGRHQIRIDMLEAITKGQKL